MKKYLVCHTEGVHDEGHIFAKVGVKYEILSEDNEEFLIIDEVDEHHWFSEEPDEEGYSYSTWFTLIEE